MRKELEIRLKIIQIYKYFLLHKKMTTDEIVDLYIEYLKLSVCLGTNKPDFEENINKYSGTNCYCYALGISFPKLFEDRYMDAEIDEFSHNLGFISQSRDARNVDEELENLYRDLNVLNIKFYETDIYSENRFGGYKIALYSAPDDFHFIRQNSNGLWSEKQGYTSRIVQMEQPKCRNKRYKLIKTLEIVKPTIR